MTIGEDRVRTKFNPSANGLVDQIKQKTAELIDLCESMRQPAGTGGPDVRCLALAQTSYEEAAMWAVKAATAEPAKKPTVEELERLLNSEDKRPISINPDGTISEVAA